MYLMAFVSEPELSSPDGGTIYSLTRILAPDFKAGSRARRIFTHSFAGWL